MQATDALARDASEAYLPVERYAYTEPLLVSSDIVAFPPLTDHAGTQNPREAA